MGFILKHNFLEHSQNIMVKNDYVKYAWAKVLKIHKFITDGDIGAKKHKCNKKATKIHYLKKSSN